METRYKTKTTDGTDGNIHQNKILFTYSRLPGNKTPDTDYYILDAATGNWLNPKDGRIVFP